MLRYLSNHICRTKDPEKSMKEGKHMDRAQKKYKVGEVSHRKPITPLRDQREGKETRVYQLIRKALVQEEPCYGHSVAGKY